MSSRSGRRIPPLRQQPSSRRVAWLVTELLAPVNIAAALLVLVAWRSAPTVTQAVAWGVVAVLFAALIPLLFVVHRVRRGLLTDRHVRLREQRPLPLLAGLASVLVGLGLLAASGAPPDLMAMVGAMIAGLVVSLLVTLRWKISLHTGVTAGAVVILVLLLGPALLVLVPVVGLVGWARVELDDHNPAQTVSGALVGATVAAVAFSLLR